MRRFQAAENSCPNPLSLKRQNHLNYAYVGEFGCFCRSSSPQNTGEIQRLAYGVPAIYAPDNRSAFVRMGEAVAKDRLWQMEMSRRSAKGRLAEVIGATAVASDKETLSRAYTPRPNSKKCFPSSQAKLGATLKPMQKA
ncbi:MAG: penicillin acylase family protein [Fimbriimonadaceae bacterium]